MALIPRDPTRGFQPDNPAHAFGDWLAAKVEDYAAIEGYAVTFRPGGLVEMDFDLSSEEDGPTLYVRIKHFPGSAVTPG